MVLKYIIIIIAFIIAGEFGINPRQPETNQTSVKLVGYSYSSNNEAGILHIELDKNQLCKDFNESKVLPFHIQI